MVFVITGNGKGKTTSAIGMVVRALGRSLRCCIMQFIKSDAASTGEYEVMKKLGVAWFNYGLGFTYQGNNFEQSRGICVHGWEDFKVNALSGKYDLIVLDEFTYVLENEYVNVSDVVSFLSENKNRAGFPHVVITGRRAEQALIEISDTVSSVEELKHHYKTVSGKAVSGIDF